MSVNLSARNLLDTELPQRVAEILGRHRVPPDRLIVEVTESAAMTDPHRAVAVLTALRATGVGVSVDDFGTGNASIEYLARLPASEIKIDRSFITDILDDPRAEAIVRSTIDLASNLGLTVVAEGIETEAVLNHLTAAGLRHRAGLFDLAAAARGAVDGNAERVARDRIDSRRDEPGQARAHSDQAQAHSRLGRSLHAREQLASTAQEFAGKESREGGVIQEAHEKAGRALIAAAEPTEGSRDLGRGGATIRNAV